MFFSVRYSMSMTMALNCTYTPPITSVGTERKEKGKGKTQKYMRQDAIYSTHYPPPTRCKSTGLTIAQLPAPPEGLTWSERRAQTLLGLVVQTVF